MARSFAGEHGDVMSHGRASLGWNDGELENSRKLQQQVEKQPGRLCPMTRGLWEWTLSLAGDGPGCELTAADGHGAGWLSCSSVTKQ